MSDSVTLDKVVIEIDAGTKAATENIGAFANTLSELRTATKGGFTNLNKLAEGISNLKTASNGLKSATEKLSSLTQISSTLESLSNIPTPRGLSATIRNLERLPEAFDKFNTTSLENMARVSKELSVALEPLANQLGKISQGYSAINQMADRYGKSATKIRTYTKQQTDYYKKLASAMGVIGSAAKGIGRNTETILKKVGKASETAVHKIKRIGLALLGTRSIFTATRKAVSEYMAMDEKLTWERTNAWRALGAQLAPAMEYVIYIFKQFVRVIYSVILALTGIDLISRANAKAMAGWGKAAKDTLGNLQKFDDLNVVEFPKDTGGGGDDGLIKLDAIDLTPIMKIIEWVRKLKAEIENAWDTGKWYGVGKVLAEGINKAIDAINADKIYKKMTSIMSKVADGINGFFENLNGANIGKLIEVSFLTIPVTLNALLERVNWGIIGVRITEALDNIDFERIVTEIADVLINWFNGLQQIILNIDPESVATSITGIIMGVLKSAIKFLETIKWDELGKKVHDVLVNIDWKSIWAAFAKTIKLGLGAIGKTLASILFGDDFKSEAANAFVGLGVIVGGLLAGTIGRLLMSTINKVLNDLPSMGILSKFGGKKSDLGGGGFKVPEPKTILKGLADLAIIIGGVAVLVTAIGLLQKIPGLTEVMDSGIDMVKDLFTMIGSIIVPLTLLSALTGVMGMIGVATIAKGLADLAIVIGGTTAIVGVIGALTSIDKIGEVMSTGISMVHELFTKLGDVMLPIAVTTGLMVALGFVSPEIMLAGMAGLAIVIDGVALIVASLGALMQIDGFYELVGTGGELLVKLGNVLGSFGGAIVEAFVGKAFDSIPSVGKNLSDFMNNSKPFFEGLTGIDESSAIAVKNIAQMILYLTAASVLDSLTKWVTGGANKNIKSFGEMLPVFGGYVKEYSEIIKGIDTNLIEATSKAVMSIMEFVQLLPYTDGLWQKVAGEQNLAKFGAMLPGFGSNVKKYSDNIKGMDADFVTKSSDAVKAIMGFADLVPKSDGLWQKIAGEKNLGSFGKTLASFGESFKKYYESIKGISIAAVNNVTDAIKKIVDVYQQIKDNKLDKTVTDFGNALSSSSGTINSFFSNTFSSSKGWNVGYSFGSSLASGISSGMRNSRFPTLSLKSNNSGETLQTFRISAYANGGYVDSGQFFFANENGVPEYVGSIGNRAAVANNEQIIEGIKRGVREAMMEVDMVQPVTVNLGNKTLYQEQHRYNRRQNDKYGTDVNI